MLPLNNGCPYLLLAPMEGVGDKSFRKAAAFIGGFDEAVREFLRVPQNAHIKSLASVYEPWELNPILLAPQIMGGDPELMALMAQELMNKGAHRIDVNCGCPSNTVTGRGAGSSLLKDPRVLYDVIKAVVSAVPIPVTVKMRSGYEDTSLFAENLRAAEESGAQYITLHPRTKKDGYGPPAKWELIAKAKSLLKIPLVGNGDILTSEDAIRMWRQTGCDALMIGRGSIINPFIFHEIRAHLSGVPYEPSLNALTEFLNIFSAEMPENFSMKLRVGKLKQLFGFLFKANTSLLAMRQTVLRSSLSEPEALLSFAVPLLANSYF